MRTLTLSGQEFIVHPLKGRDIRTIQEKQDDNYIATVLAVAGFWPERTDDLPFPEVKALLNAVQAETFGDPEEEKNL